MNAVQLMSNGIQQQPQHHATVLVPLVDVEDLEPQPRDRCNTWPLQKPTGDLSHNTSPLIHEVLPEEEDGLNEDDEDDDSSLEAASDASVTNGFGGYSPTTGMNRGGQTVAANQQHHHCSMSAAAANSKKNSSRRNAWGNLSYADLITQAILSSPDNRLTLSQIYDWMVHNVPYFRDKGDSNSSAGWKNSIRHNLSLHSRFMRVQNEGAGKSSWWMINPDAKHGKCSRRRTGSMEQSSKLWEKKRGRLKKSANGDEVAYSAVSMETLPLSDDLDNNGGGASMDFRCRVGSTYSSSVASRHGGSDPQLLDDAWADGNGIVDGHVSSNDAADSHSPYTALVETLPQSMTLLETKTSSSNNDLQVQQHSPYRAPKLEYSPGHAYTNGHCQQSQQHHVQIKQEPLDNGPLLSDVFERLYYASPPQQQAPVTNYHQQQRVMLSPYRNSSVDDHHGQQMRRLNYYYYHAPSTAALVVNNDQLPSELSELHYDSYFKSDVQWDIDQVIRHELTLTGKLDFNDLANV